MQPNRQIIAILLSIQVLILVGMIGTSMYPLLYGTEIKMKVRPLDPRDLMRGNYVRLSYDYNRLSLAEEGESFMDEFLVKNQLDTERDINYGEVVFVKLEETEGFYAPTELWSHRPSGEGIYLKASVEYHYGDNINLKSGIEDFYTDVKHAKALEKALAESATRENTYAVVKVAKNGAARLVDVRVE